MDVWDEETKKWWPAQLVSCNRSAAHRLWRVTFPASSSIDCITYESSVEESRIWLRCSAVALAKDCASGSLGRALVPNTGEGTPGEALGARSNIPICLVTGAPLMSGSQGPWDEGAAQAWFKSVASQNLMGMHSQAGQVLANCSSSDAKGHNADCTPSIKSMNQARFSSLEKSGWEKAPSGKEGKFVKYPDEMKGSKLNGKGCFYRMLYAISALTYADKKQQETALAKPWPIPGFRDMHSLQQRASALGLEFCEITDMSLDTVGKWQGCVVLVQRAKDSYWSLMINSDEWSYVVDESTQFRRKGRVDLKPAVGPLLGPPPLRHRFFVARLFPEHVGKRSGRRSRRSGVYSNQEHVDVYDEVTEKWWPAQLESCNHSAVCRLWKVRYPASSSSALTYESSVDESRIRTRDFSVESMAMANGLEVLTGDHYSQVQL